NVRILSPADGERVKEGTELWLNASAEDIDAFDVLKYSWFDNGEPLGEGKSIKVKLKPGRHTLSLEVSDGTEKALAEVSIDVLKAEKVTVQDTGWLVGAGIALGVVLIVVAAAIVAIIKKSRKIERKRAGAAATTETERGAEGAEAETRGAGPGLRGEGAGAEAAMGAAAAKGPRVEEDEMLVAARKFISKVEDGIGEFLERHPDKAAVALVAMEKLEFARDFLKDGDGEVALQFAMEARAVLGNSSAAATMAERKPVERADGQMCPSCGEALEPEWTVCPACGHGRR
ncbi:MAG: hypothetical protein QW379_10070, partial [Thermoplasmata archaeon]